MTSGVAQAATAIAGPRTHKRQIASYQYTSEAGELLYEVIRYEPKTFRQRRPVGSGWEWGLGDVRRVLYRLPKVLDAAEVYVVEGEKDVEALEKIGLVATTNSGGASQPWRDEYTEALRGKRVVIIPDSDEPGRKHGAKIKEALTGAAAEVIICDLPRGFKDVSDFFECGWSDGLRDLIEAASAKPEACGVARLGREFRSGDETATGGGRGLFSHNSLISHTHTLAPEALYGVVGEIVRAIEPHTEADPAAILIQTLVGVGNLIGRNAHFNVEADRHYLNLNAVIVGDTSKARKGTSWGHVRHILETVEPEWAEKRILGGLASGEGLIWAVRDPIIESQPIKKGGRVEDYQDVAVDDGVRDKRLLVVEPEFGRVLQVCERDTNTLSAVIREAWDTGALRTMTKSKAATATGAHVSIIGHVTRDELLRLLTDTQSANGFGNRFLWVAVKRSKLLPEGGRFYEENINPIVDRLGLAVAFGRRSGTIGRDTAARALWREVYAGLSEGRRGLVGALTSRAEAQTMRLATLYAVLDCSNTIKTAHLAAALAVWRYCEASVETIFGDAVGDPVADAILSALRSSGEMPRNSIVNLLGRHKNKERINMALESLSRLGLIACNRIETGGRPAEVWRAVSAR